MSIYNIHRIIEIRLIVFLCIDCPRQPLFPLTRMIQVIAAEKEKTADPEKTQEQYDKLKEEVSADVDPNDPMYRKIDFAAAQGTNIRGFVKIIVTHQITIIKSDSRKHPIF